MAITQGHAIICCDRNRRGGLKRIWLMEQDNLDTATNLVAYAGTGEIIVFDSVAWTSVNLAGWYEFEFDRGTAGFNANATRENGSTLVNVELEFYVPKITEQINARLRELTESCGVYALCESFADDCNDTAPETYFFLLGYDKVFERKAYMEFSSGEQTTGMGLQDANGTAIKLAGVHAEYPREMTIALKLTADAPGTGTSGAIDMYQATASGLTKTDVWVTKEI
tara:strand:+ start:1682 stop:2356 length:675 start_codon:yes stop_codon:yes gene_type:complete